MSILSTLLLPQVQIDMRERYAQCHDTPGIPRMNEPLDQADREITAALLRNGRASWRLISQVTGIQERTVARRGTRLLETGLVKVRALSQPHLVDRGEGHFAQITCPPSELRRVAEWLAKREETLWVVTLAGTSTITSECFIRDRDRPQFLEEELAGFPVSGYSFAYIDRHWRTVRGWHPNILTEEQLDLLGEDEARALQIGNAPRLDSDQSPDEVDVQIVRQLSIDGRLSIDAIANAVGIAKPTVRRRISQLQQTDYLSIRAVVDPELLGFPLEALITVEAPVTMLDAIGRHLSEDWRTRWAAEVSARSEVQALVTLRTKYELSEMLTQITERFGADTVRTAASPILSHYKRSDVVISAD